MRLNKYVIFLLGFLATCLGIQTRAQVLNDIHGEPLQTGGGLLWRITGKDLQSPSYVFGTIHAICPEDYFFTPEMQRAFQSAQRLVMEVDLNDPLMTDMFQETLLLPQGKAFSDFFESVEECDRFARVLAEKKQIDLEMFKSFKPFVLISALAMKGLSCETASSYEVNLSRMSKERDMPVSGLESAAFQLSIFDKMDAAFIRNLLWESVADDSVNAKMEKQMVELYKAQDLDGLYDLVRNSGEFKGHEKEFLTGRNKAWMTLLPNWMKEGACFVAVGAAHLPGESGVLNLLRKAGYSVEAVN